MSLILRQNKRNLLCFTSAYHTNYGDRGLQLLKSYIRKIKENCKNDQPVVFKILCDVCKIEFFCNTKDRTPIINQSFVVYELTCPGCGANYAGKTEITLYERYVEQS